MTQKEIVVRYLLSKNGAWVFGHDIVKNASSVIGKDYIIQDGDTRAYDLAREGFYDSPNNRYFIEHRKQGKYAQFRVSKVEPLESWVEKNRRGLQWFDNLHQERELRKLRANSATV